MELKNFTIKEIHQGLTKKEFSALELCRAYLDKIEKDDKKIRAFLVLDEDAAISQAKKVDKMFLHNKKIPLLAGVPCAIKDNILVEGMKCSAASKILRDYLAPYDATVVKKLKSDGVLILGKTNLDEFAMGSSTENSAFFPTRNPHDLSRVPGGSSGGSAAAVAADFCVFSLGSDTGGSIRQPSSFCGVVGLKPTYGSVSRYGLIAFASSLDQIGPITKTVEDCQIVFDAIKGKDELDATSLELNFQSLDFDSRLKISNIRIGVPKEYFVRGIDEGVEKIIKEAIKKYESYGVKIEEINLPHTEYALPCYCIIATSEASANLARYDGIKYGFSVFKKQKTKRINTLLDVYLKSRGGGFGPEVRRRIILGTYTLSAGYYEAYYLKAQMVRTLIKKDFERAFQNVDLILTPTSPSPAFKIGERTSDPLTMYLSDIFTVAVNLAGLPAISVPVNKTINHLPVGLQIIGNYFDERKIFQAARIFELSKSEN